MDAASVFRTLAIKNNNEFLIQKYSAYVYDQRLKSGLIKYRNNILLKKTNSLLIISRKLFYKYICEPIILLIFSSYSGERLLLWLNKYSNDYNRSWTRGVCFTAIIALIFYFILNYWGLTEPIFVVDWKFHNFKIVSEGYLNLIDIFELSKGDYIFPTNVIGKYIIFIARIFIVYGIYQTIYAFYKYKK